MSDLISTIRHMIRPLETRIANMVARGVLRRVDDSKKMQLLQVEFLSGEVRAALERFQEYGFTSVPIEGAEAAVMFVGGGRDHGLVVGVDDRRYRPTGLQPGEVALYDKTGTTIVLKANGDVVITPSSGTVTVNGDVMAGSISLKSHTHGVGTLADPQGGTITGATGGPS